LLRIPGIGVRNVKRILQVRQYQAIRVADLKKLRVAWNRAKAFVLTTDYNPAVRTLERADLQRRMKPKSRQLSLFDDAISAHSGEI